MLHNVSVVSKCSNKQDLHVLLALFIREFNIVLNILKNINAIINRQTNYFIRKLKIF